MELFFVFFSPGTGTMSAVTWNDPVGGVAESVTWLWPLIDRPHRITTSTNGGADAVFIDDDLAVAVATSGRLDRALQVLEQIGPQSQVIGADAGVGVLEEEVRIEGPAE